MLNYNTQLVNHLSCLKFWLLEATAILISDEVNEIGAERLVLLPTEYYALTKKNA